LSKKLPRFAVISGLLALLAAPTLAQNLAGPTGTAPVAAVATGGKPAAPTAAKPGKPADKPADAGKPGDKPADAAPVDPHPGDGVAALVNDAPITEYDLRQRILLYIATANLPNTADTVAKLRDQILKQLETEQLQIQEARRKNITVSPTDVDKSIDRIIGDNHMTKDQLADLLKRAGVAMATLRGQIAVQIAWQKAVQDEFQDRINIAPSDVDAELARLTEGADKPHFLVSSIFLAVDNPDQDDKVKKDAQDIYAQLQAGAQFSTVARQFSQSPTAASGGDLGWVHQGQLPAELDAEIQKMQPGQVSQPIRATGGYYIIGLRDRQEGVGFKAPDPATLAKPTGPLTVARLLLPTGPKPPKEYLETVVKIANQIREHVDGCDGLPKLSEQVHGLVYQDLQKMGLRIADLSPQIQDAINKAGPGEATVPFQTEAGVEMMVRCDHRPPKANAVFTPPTRQEVEETLFDQQITMLARRYIRDLRRSAHVEIK
jgi:peptidyl-prolyl cis-trans isomerase SurA